MPSSRARTAALLITAAALVPLGRTVAVALATPAGDSDRSRIADDLRDPGSCPDRAQRRADAECPDAAADSEPAALLATIPGAIATPAPAADSPELDRARSPLDPMVNLDAAIAAITLAAAPSASEGAGWPTLRAKAASSIADGEDLFEVLSSLLASAGPASGAWLHATDGRVWAADLPSSPAETRRLSQLATLIDERYAATEAAVHAGGSLVTARLGDGTLYIRPQSPRATSDSESALLPDRAAATELLDALASSLDGREPVVIDLRFPAAACLWDPIALARRIGHERTLAFHIEGPSPAVSAAPVHLDPSEEPRVTGPVVLLIGPQTSGSGETLALATMTMPSVTRVGRPTAGRCTAIIEHTLPNGWRLALPGARLLTWDAEALDAGIAPHIAVDAEVPGATESDAAIEAALDYLDRLRRSGLIR